MSEVGPDTEALNTEGCRVIAAASIALWVIIVAVVKSCWVG